MVLKALPQASDTNTSLLHKLKPEARLRIYHFTQTLRLEAKRGGATEILSKAWKSTPLYQLANTCRLMRKEAPHFVRSLPAAQRIAFLEISESRGPDSPWQIRLSSLPCPVSDLTRIVVTYDFAGFRSASFGSPTARTDLAAFDAAMQNLEKYLFDAVRQLMNYEALRDATALKFFGLRFTGMQRSEGKSWQNDTVRRILDRKCKDPASADRIVRGIVRRGGLDREVGDERPLRLAVFGGRSLYFVP